MTTLTTLLVTTTLLLSTVGGQDGFVDLSDDPTIFETDRLPSDESGVFLPRYMPSVGNGHISTTVYTDTVYVNGLYNGDRGNSHRARVPSRSNIRLNLENSTVSEERFYLDVIKATFFNRLVTTDWTVEQRVFAHRFYSRLLVTQIQVTTTSAEPPELLLNLTSTPGNASADISFNSPANYSGDLYTCGVTVVVENSTYQPEPSAVCVYWMSIPESLTVKENTTFTFISSVDQSDEVARQEFHTGKYFINSGQHDQLFQEHVAVWRQIWSSGRIQLEGNNKLSKVVHGSFYYILSSLPSPLPTNTAANPFYGLSPGGLAYGDLLLDYQGHSFWDTETWMFPSVLMFWPTLAQEAIAYRINQIQAARDRAQETGYRGARYPWESAFTGKEVTPDCCPENADNQQHITGDVAFAARQLVSATRDVAWLTVPWLEAEVNGCEFLREIADFWASRPTYNNATGWYEINGVMPPDEDHPNVNNSVYTNVIAGMSIFFAEYASCLCGSEPLPDDWMTVARRLKYVFDTERQYHPEYDGYTIGEEIKQADAVLLGFPLMYYSDVVVRRNDLEIYQNVTRDSGPAMTWSMHSIGWQELGELEQAEVNFNRSYQPYMREPFKVWTEMQGDLGAVNFITGMGGFLQAVLFGYGGVRLHVEELHMSPSLPPGVSHFNITGLNYLGASLGIYISNKTVEIQVDYSATNFTLQLTQDGVTHLLEEDVIFVFSRSFFIINATSPSNCPLPEDQIGQRAFSCRGGQQIRKMNRNMKEQETSFKGRDALADDYIKQLLSKYGSRVHQLRNRKVINNKSVHRAVDAN